jgi:hypothetical protein
MQEREVKSKETSPAMDASGSEISKQEVAAVSLLDDWDEYAEFEQQVRQCCAEVDKYGNKSYQDNAIAPAMPVVREDIHVSHRARTTVHPVANMALVARAVGRSDMLSNKAALEAVQAESLALHGKVWNFRKACSKHDVIREARDNKRTVQFCRIHTLCHEKNEELPMGHPKRKLGEWYSWVTTL